MEELDRWRREMKEEIKIWGEEMKEWMEEREEETWLGRTEKVKEREQWEAEKEMLCRWVRELELKEQRWEKKKRRCSAVIRR